VVKPVKKVKELRELTDEELEKKADRLKDELFRLRFQLATGQLEIQCGSERSKEPLLEQKP